MPHHVVQTIRFNLTVRSRPQARRVQDVISRFAALEMPDLIQRCFDGLPMMDQVLVLDRLDLDLGTIREADLSRELPTRVARSLADALFVALDRRDQERGEAFAGKEVPNARYMTPDTHRRQILDQFLEFGIFYPPIDADEAQTPDALIKRLLANDPDSIEVIVLWWRRAPDQRRRLAAQFSRPTIDQLIALLAGGHRAPGLAILRTALRRILETDPNSSGTVAASGPDVEAVLEALMDPKAQTSLTALAHDVLRRTALAAGWEVDDLLVALRRDLANDATSGTAVTPSTDETSSSTGHGAADPNSGTDHETALSDLLAALADDVSQRGDGDVADEDDVPAPDAAIASEQAKTAGITNDGGASDNGSFNTDPGTAKVAVRRSNHTSVSMDAEGHVQFADQNLIGPAAGEAMDLSSGIDAATPEAAVAAMRPAETRDAAIERFVATASRARMLAVLRFVAPGFAGFVETVLLTAEAIEETASSRGPGRPFVWRAGLALLIATEARGVEPKQFVADLGRIIAQARGWPTRVYLRSIGAEAARRAMTDVRYVPLVEAVEAFQRTLGPGSSDPPELQLMPARRLLALPAVAPAGSGAFDQTEAGSSGAGIAGDGSLADFVSRHLGSDTIERLAQLMRSTDWPSVQAVDAVAKVLRDALELPAVAPAGSGAFDQTEAGSSGAGIAGDASLADFVSRHLGSDTIERLAQLMRSTDWPSVQAVDAAAKVLRDALALPAVAPAGSGAFNQTEAGSSGAGIAGDASLADFVSRPLGSDTIERLAQLMRSTDWPSVQAVDAVAKVLRDALELPAVAPAGSGAFDQTEAGSSGAGIAGDGSLADFVSRPLESDAIERLAQLMRSTDWPSVQAVDAVAKVLRDALELDGMRTIAFLRNHDPMQTAQFVVRYAPIEILRQLIERLAPGRTDEIPGPSAPTSVGQTGTISSDLQQSGPGQSSGLSHHRDNRITELLDADLPAGGLATSRQIAALPVKSIAGAPQSDVERRSVPSSNNAPADIALPHEAASAKVDRPSAEDLALELPDGPLPPLGPTRQYLLTGGPVSDEERQQELEDRAISDPILFGSPIILDGSVLDPLDLLRSVIRDGVLPAAYPSSDTLLDRDVEEAVARAPEALAALLSTAADYPASLHHMVTRLSATALDHAGRLIFSGESARALDFAQSLIRGGWGTGYPVAQQAPGHAVQDRPPGQPQQPEDRVRTGSIAALYASLFRTVAKTGRAVGPFGLIAQALRDVAASENLPVDTILLRWRTAIARARPADPASLQILRSLQSQPPLRPSPSPARNGSGRPNAWRTEPSTKASRELVILVKNAGLVLLAPYFGTLFRRLDLLEDGDFRNETARGEAVEVLHYLVFVDAELREYEAGLTKVLCGFDLETPLAAASQLSGASREMCDSLLGAALQAWPTLRNSTVETLRETFLQRNGRLTRGDDVWKLQVEAKPYDMLIDTVPWSFKQIKSRWMKTLLQVDWR